jgi:DNA uptake protein ComE-like DNA-binding protein
LAANRLQRYAIFLSVYNYEIQFIKGTDNRNADALSRLSLEFPHNIKNSELDNYSINLITENINVRVWKRHVNHIINRMISKSCEDVMLNMGVNESTVDNKQIKLNQEVVSSNNVTFSFVSTGTFIRKSERIIKPPKRLDL